MKTIIIILFFHLVYLSAQNSIEMTYDGKSITKPGMETEQDVMDYYELEVKKDSSSIENQEILAYLYYSEEQYNEAIPLYIKLIETMPDSNNYKVVIYYSKCLEKTGNIEKAKMIIEDRIPRSGYPHFLQYRLARIQMGLGEDLKTFITFTEIDTSKMTKIAHFWNDYACACIAADTSMTEALSYVNRSIQIRPTWFSYDTLGDIYFKMKQYENAIEAYEEVLKLFEFSAVKEKIRIVKEKLYEASGRRI